eukprot:CAMPEP_0179079240 /NCGR_PEP_ID=MMETSP0796-20121207/35540_1 /TAXON_ID=73915 /ORGANISM="Pyrodinium bahamense, Strain pbaha01" /LENGTH=40 /DNA_ID= /DNA_START= /DNA_END= /DNA_ORIENTATION=
MLGAIASSDFVGRVAADMNKVETDKVSDQVRSCFKEVEKL